MVGKIQFWTAWQMASDDNHTGNRKSAFHQVAHRLDADDLFHQAASLLTAANEREQRDAKRRELLALRFQ